MHSYSVAHSFVVSPIIRKLTQPDSVCRAIKIRTGIDRTRARQIFANEGEPIRLDEIARLSAFAGLELSVVPSGSASRAFTEVERYLFSTEDVGSYPKRVVDMIEKVCDFCVDVRLDTGLSGDAFDRAFPTSENFLAGLCDVGKAGDITFKEMFGYLEKFGATLAAFPRQSDFTNYYRTLATLDAEEKATSSLPISMVA